MITSEINKAKKKVYIDSWNMVTSEIYKAKKKPIFISQGCYHIPW